MAHSESHPLDDESLWADSWVDEAFFLLQKSLSRAGSTHLSLSMVAAVHDAAAALEDIVIPACRVALQRSQARRSALEVARAVDRRSTGLLGALDDGAGSRGPPSSGGSSRQRGRVGGGRGREEEEAPPPADLADTLAAVLFSGGEEATMAGPGSGAERNGRPPLSGEHSAPASGERRGWESSPAMWVSCMRDDAFSALNGLSLASDYSTALVARLAHNLSSDFGGGADGPPGSQRSAGSSSSQGGTAACGALPPPPSEALNLPALARAFRPAVDELLRCGDAVHGLLKDATERFGQVLARRGVEAFYRVALETE